MDASDPSTLLRPEPRSGSPVGRPTEQDIDGYPHGAPTLKAL